MGASIHHIIREQRATCRLFTAIPKTHGFGMPKAAQKKRQNWPFLTTAGGMVFGMVLLAAFS
jgi:hypothetical protein